MTAKPSTSRPSQFANEPDHVLVAMARRNEPCAIDTLIDRHYSAVLRFLTRQTRDPHLAQDLTQEVFTTVYTRLAQLRDDAAFLPWLYRIARNTYHSSYRRNVQLISIAVTDWFDRGSSGRMKPVIGRGRSVVDIDDADFIQHVLDRLRPEYRELLLLRHLVGFTLDEVAMIIDCTRSTTQRRINRAEASFRHTFASIEARTDGRQPL